MTVFERLKSTGTETATVTVSIGPQFLQLFSEQLYSSPNKAFEELVSNSWDAGATSVYIGMPDELASDSAFVWVLDNGESMNLDGIRALWAVAFSTKPQKVSGRPQIGKFGIGKLSTYILAHELTYVCQAADGLIRAVTMDYRRISDAPGDGLHIEPLPLAVRIISAEALDQLLADISDRHRILDLIRKRVPQVDPGALKKIPNEFGTGDGVGAEATPLGTWTLAIMTDLKEAGRSMEKGRIKRMLRTALPLGDTLTIDYRTEPLLPTKLDLPVTREWQLGSGMGIQAVELPGVADAPPTTYAVTEHSAPYPHLTVEGVPGRITGSMRLFKESISGGKSSAIAPSNGFFVNILGRVVNPQDPYFALSNLNHSSWARTRVAVRADGLNTSVSVDRDSVHEDDSIRIFRMLLRALFNKARSEYDASVNADWPEAGDAFTKKYGTVPIEPLRRLLEGHTAEDELPEFVFAGDPNNWPAPGEAINPGELVEDVLLEGLGPDSPLVRYDASARQILVNTDHPFAREHSATHEEKLLLRDSGFVDLLTQAYMLDIGVPNDTLSEVLNYRDHLYRLVARLRRKSALQLAEMLDQVTNDAKALEHALSESLEYLGYVVHFISGSGEPEGVASAPITPNARGAKRSYTFTFDAKSSKTGRVSNGDVRVSTLIRHRTNHNADYALVVAPDFADGALWQECEAHKVTPMRAKDLSALLILHGTSGPIPLEMLQEMFQYFHPEKVQQWLENLESRLNVTPRLSFDEFFAALVSIGYLNPDTLTVSVISSKIRDMRGSTDFPAAKDVQKVVSGLSVMMPDLVRSTGEKVVLGAEPAVIRDEVVKLLGRVPERLRFESKRSGGPK